MKTFGDKTEVPHGGGAETGLGGGGGSGRGVFDSGAMDLPRIGKKGGYLPRVGKRVFLGGLRFLRGGESGQAMAEACVLIPVLLMLFMGMWQHALLQLAQTRAELAARHVAWARAVLGKSEKDAKKYAEKFFPPGTKLQVVQDSSASYTDYGNNLTGICAGLFPPEGGGNGQYKATVTATVPALPTAPPKSPGGKFANDAWDFLASVKTHGATVVWNNSVEQPKTYTFPLICFIVARPELLLELVGNITLSELFNKLIHVLGDVMGHSGWFSNIMSRLHLDFLGDLFPDIAETFLWLLNDLYDIIRQYAGG